MRITRLTENCYLADNGKGLVKAARIDAKGRMSVVAGFTPEEETLAMTSVFCFHVWVLNKGTKQHD
jgi:hypothetical protein